MSSLDETIQRQNQSVFKNVNKSFYFCYFLIRFPKVGFSVLAGKKIVQRCHKNVFVMDIFGENLQETCGIICLTLLFVSSAGAHISPFLPSSSTSPLSLSSHLVHSFCQLSRLYRPCHLCAALLSYPDCFISLSLSSFQFAFCSPLSPAQPCYVFLPQIPL